MLDDLNNLHDDILNDSNSLLSPDNTLDVEQTLNHDVFHDSSMYDYGNVQHDSEVTYYPNDSNSLLSPDNTLDAEQTLNHDVCHDSDIYDYGNVQHDSEATYYNSFDNNISDTYYHPDSTAHHASFHSDSDSNNVYHEHSGTVYHEHYWEKPKPLDTSGGGGESYDNSVPATASPAPENQGCVDNNNDGQCDSNSGSDSD